MQLILFDTLARQQLFPFTAIRPVADIRIGLRTNRERWESFAGTTIAVLTESYLMDSGQLPQTDAYLYINAHLIPDEPLMHMVLNLPPETSLLHGDMLIACKTKQPLTYPVSPAQISQLKPVFADFPLLLLDHPCKLFSLNKDAIAIDFELVTRDRKSAHISTTNHIIGREQVFLEQGAVMEYCTINATFGPVYIGKDSLIMENTVIRGPFALLEGATVKMATSIYGATTIGKFAVAGGEIKNTVIMDYANKAHHGYLGDAVIGSWCNLGAGTSCSNVKNTAGSIRLWNPLLHEWIDAGHKCGMFMGDFSRTAINSSVNTGTVIGVSANVISSAFTPKFIDHFIWNIETGEPYVLEKVFKDIDNWMKLKAHALTSPLQNILSHLYKQSKHEKTDRSS